MKIKEEPQWKRDFAKQFVGRICNEEGTGYYYDMEQEFFDFIENVVRDTTVETIDNYDKAYEAWEDYDGDKDFYQFYFEWLEEKKDELPLNYVGLKGGYEN